MFPLQRQTQELLAKFASEPNTSTSAPQQTPGNVSRSQPGPDRSDINNNGILDSHEKWFLFVRMLVLVWSLSLLTYSYFGSDKVDRAFVATTFTASVASFGVKRLSK
jgi:hypothetical protein